MRFLARDSAPLSLADLNDLLKAKSDRWHLQTQADARRPSATLNFGNELLGELEINQPGDGLFEEEIEELLEFLEDAGEGDRDRIQQLLQKASVLYAVRVLWQGREAEETLGNLDSLWDVLFSQHNGLLQADSDGYYDLAGQILAMS